MKRFFSAFLSAMVLISATILGCSNDIDNKSSLIQQALVLSQQSNSYGSLKIEGDSSRALKIDELKSAIVTVKGYDNNGSTFEKNKCVSVTDGKASSIVINSIPVCKNAVVLVQAYSDANGTEILNGTKLYAVTDIKSGENSINVTWETSKKGIVYAALLDASVNTNILTSAQLSSIESALPSDTHASLINAAAIATAFKAGSLGDASTYKLNTGSVKVTCNDYNGCTLQLTDPLTSTETASTSNSVTISGAAPGTWTLYVLDGTTVKAKKIVTVTSGGEVSVTVGTATFDGIQIQVAKSLGYPLIHYWTCSDSTKYPNTSWPGIAMLTDWNDDDYIYNFEGCSSVNLLITNSSGDKLCNTDVKITAKGAYRITSSGASASTYISDEPTPPTYTLPSSATLGGTFKIVVTSSTDLTSGTVSIGGVTKTLVVGENTFNVSDFTTSATTLTVSGTLTNEAGSTSVSGSIVVKEQGKLVTNPNELRIYQVMVSSFQDGDPSIGYTTAYGPSGALTGGDLRGIINAVDYIKDLGINALWMTPIFQSAGNSQLDSTGYFCSNYFEVDNHFGTNTILKELIETYHSKGIAVILDGVFGHHGGSVGPSPSGYNVSGTDPVYYTNEGTRNFYKEVAEYWIKNYKIDGWRLDQCYQVGLGAEGNGDNCNTGGHNYWYDIRLVVADAAASNGTKGTDWGTLGYMVGEHWKGDAALIQKGSINPGSAAGYGLQSCFDFPSRYRIINALAKAESDAGGESLGSNLSYVYKTPSQKGYTHPDGYIPNLFVTNHDLVRLGNLINWKHSETPSSENYWKRHKLALAIVAAYTGPITIYYGDEWGAYVDGYTGPGALGAYNDNAARSTGKISGFNSNEQNLHDYAASLMEMRSSHEALWNGTNTDIKASGDCYVGKKEGGGETIYYAINNGTSSTSFTASGTDLLTGATYNGTVTVPALSAVYVLAK